MTYFNTKAGSVEESVKGLSKDLNDSAYQDMFKKELEKTGKGIASMSPKEKKDFFNKIDAKYSAKTEELSAAQKKLPPALQKAIKDKEDKKEEVKEGGPGSGPQKGGAKKSNFTSAQIKQAYGILNDPRYKQGNYSGAVKTINKVSPGLADHPDVKNALKRANESLDEMAKDKAYAIGMSTAKKKYNDEPPLEKKTIKKGHEIADKLMGMKKEETIKEFKKMTVTFKTMDKMAKASTDLAKHGFTIHAKGLVMKVDGKGDDLNKYATDLKNFYGATVKAEENAPTLSDLERMKKQGLKPKKEETQHDLAKMKFEQIAGLKKKAEKSGMPYSILKKVYDRGMAAWRGGHRPGASQQQWAFARVNSFVTKSSGTWGGADKDLAAKVKGSKK